MLISGIFY